jgi:hypothetical protein
VNPDGTVASGPCRAANATTSSVAVDSAAVVVAGVDVPGEPSTPPAVRTGVSLAVAPEIRIHRTLVFAVDAGVITAEVVPPLRLKMYAP